MADGALDAWSLGVVAFELLTKTQAFQMVVKDNDEVRPPNYWCSGHACTCARVCAAFAHSPRMLLIPWA
jgi:hypothetical protein